MSLLSPTPGEIMDRLSILALKLDAYRKAGKGTEWLSTEESRLREYLCKFSMPRDMKDFQDRLADINLTIWEAEDEVRAWRSPHGHAQLCEFALRIAKYNDFRSNIIREIDAACGIDSVEEKIYSKTL